jgi:membrane protein DedA with SNARE-associated domain
MTSSPFHFLRMAWLSTASIATLYAHPGHPGHDGDELVWELSHLSVHPVATVVCLAILITGAVLAWQLANRRLRSVQSFRGSQANRGN